MKHVAVLRFSPRSAPAVAFFVWFALWVVAGRYVSIDFYRLNFGSAIQSALALATLLAALALMFVPVMRPRRGQLRWSYPLLSVGLLATCELVWRFTNHLPTWDAAKVVGFILHLSTPALIAFGVAVVVGEWQQRRPEAAAATTA